MKKFIGLDCETGGVSAKDTSLLSVYFGICDENFEFVEGLELFVRPDKDEPYRVTAGALAVNKINLIEHDKIAIKCQEAKTQLFNFLKEHTNDGKNKLTPIGHNVNFDLYYLYEHLLKKPAWDKFCSYRVRDTASLGQDLMEMGILPKTIRGSLGSYAKHFGIDASGAHDAKEDVIMTVKVYKAMIELAKSKMKN